MKILYSPQRNDKKIGYTFTGDKITAILDGLADTFDFSTVPNGVLDIKTLETILPIKLIITAERIDGVLSVTLLNFIGINASQQEKYPEWIEVV